MGFVVPTGHPDTLSADILRQSHVLIAGTTGSGKSVLINNLIYSLLYQSPDDVGLVLIDPKRVELRQYAKLPHTVRYASEPDEIITVLNECVAQMESRYKTMVRHGQKKSLMPDLYIIVDEFADLMTTAKKWTLAPLCRIAQLGRAANMHLILATQRPTRDIINGQIKVNLDARVALRCPTAQDSRNVISVAGAELLPKYGYGLYSTPDLVQPVKVNIPRVADASIYNMIRFWQRQRRLFYRNPSWMTKIIYFKNR